MKGKCYYLETTIESAGRNFLCDAGRYCSRLLLSASEKVEKIMKRRSLPFIQATNKMRKEEGRQKTGQVISIFWQGVFTTLMESTTILNPVAKKISTSTKPQCCLKEILD